VSRGGALRRAEHAIPWVALVAAVLVPFTVASGYWVTVLTTLLVNVVLVLGLNFMIGYAGLLNLGYAVFVGLGAYGTSLAMRDWSFGFWPALLVGIVVSVIAAVVIAMPTLRLSKVYLGIVTLALGEIFGLLALNLTGLTGGAAGVVGITRPTLLGLAFGSTAAFYCLVLAVTVLLVVLALRWDRSHVGRAFRYVREDEVAAEASGIDTRRTKLLAFAIGATYAAVGGGLTAVQFQAINPDTFDFSVTLLILTMLAIGGSGSLPGVIVGAAIFTVLPEALRVAAEYRLLIYGLALTAFMLFRPEGLIPARPRPPRHAAGDEDAAPAERPAPPLAPATLAEVRGLTRRFGGLLAVDDVSFLVHPGEILGVIGPNGAGKSTLVEMFCGALRPTAGSVVYRGRVLGGERPSARARRGIGRTFQRVRLFPELTVLDNVVAASRIHQRGGLLGAIFATRRYRASERATVATALERLRFVNPELVERADVQARHLPYGLQKQVELARALAVEPELLVLDEPVAGLNSAEKRAMARLITAIRERGTAVVLIEHDMETIMSLCDRVVVIDNGAKIADADPDAVQSDARVIDAYLGREVELV
jgi:branched-chain amino acid transport system permease protein